MKTKEYEALDYETRDRLASEYLFKEGKKIYDCVNNGNDTKKCFSFKKDVIYSKKTYRDEDMVMKYPHQYHVLINNPDACSSNPRVVIGSPVGPRQYLERMGTRKSWGSVKEVNGVRIKHLFFAGQDENDPVGDRMLREENDKYHDIIQFDMKNHFMNLTLLAILTYNWTHHYCPHIAYYVRADNDLWYNPRSHIHNFLMERRSQTLIGNIVMGNKPIRVDLSRYWMPKSIFPAKQFDPYPSGCFVTIAGDTLETIVKYCEYIGPIIYFDDVFLGQIAAITNVTLLSYPGGVMEYMWKSYSPSVYMKLSAAHRYTPADVLALWQIANR